MDEGRDCRYSGEIIRAAANHAKRVLVLRPGNPGDRVITQRRGQRKYLFSVSGEPRRPGKAAKKPELLRWAFGRLEAMGRLSSPKDRVSVSVVDLKPEAFPMLLPHRISAQILLTYGDGKKADAVEGAMRGLLRDTYRGELEVISDRPPMKERRGTLALFRALRGVAEAWEIPLRNESSVWPSAAGLIPPRIPVLCGLGPVAENLYTPLESTQRISLMQRTLLLAQFLLQDARSRDGKRRR
jgi:D-alanine-D-alanine ligase